MKVTFEFSISDNGKPCIQFRHYDLDKSIEQKLLAVFIDEVRENGLVLKNPTGQTQNNKEDNLSSWEDYILEIKK
jgi:hypothetical protein